MLAPPGDLLRLGIEQRLTRVKRATNAYLRDRARDATGMAKSYAVAGAMFAAAGVFVLLAFLVGLGTLFYWVRTVAGIYAAFGTVGGILLVLALICAIIGAVRIKRPAPEHPSLTSRLRVAIASPVRDPAADDIDPDTIPLAPSARHPGAARDRSAINVPVGLGVAALLLGWAAARRRQNSRARATAAGS
jgi:putative superfamily III holin-X